MKTRTKTRTTTASRLWPTACSRKGKTGCWLIKRYWNFEWPKDHQRLHDGKRWRHQLRMMMCRFERRTWRQHHGQGKRPVKPLPRHAELAVNMAGSMASFLLATFEAKGER